MVTTATITTMMVTAMLEPPAAGERVSSAALIRLLAWLSPSFPVGAFSYSHGLEWAIEDGTVRTPADLEAWLGDILNHGAGRNDAILFVHAYAAGSLADAAAVAAIAELAAALQPSKERRLEACAQGAAFLSAVAASWPNARFAALKESLDRAPAIPYPVAVAAATATHEIPLRPALVAYLNGLAANIVSAGVRAIPIGQTDGQRIIAGLAPLVEDLAGAALASSLDDLGGAAIRADIASMKHETQYTRLFRS